METLIICKSEHQGNTQKIAESMAEVMNAETVDPTEVDEEQVIEADLVGFGSGIYMGKHHEDILDLVEELPDTDGKKAFIFSTSGMGKFPIFHKFDGKLKEKLNNKEFEILDTFSCRGLNTHGFFGILGGINKGRPNQEDIEDSKEFARKLNNSIK